jgi:hypothetical protein
VFSGAVWTTRGAGNAYERVVGDRSYYLTLVSRGWRAFVNTTFGLGAHVEFDDASATGGDVPLLGLEPKFTADWKYRRFAGGAWHDDAWVSFANRFIRVDYGTGDASYGPAVTDALVLRSDGPDMTQLRAQVGTEKLRFLYTHGSLDARPLATTDTFVTYDGRRIVTPAQPQRWVMMHRLTWSPTPKWTFSGHEMVVYGGRGPDARYLVPVLPVLGKLNEEDIGNVDNGFVGADVIYRPVAGTELFASLLIDDLWEKKFSRLVNVGRSDSTLKVAVSAGIEQRLPGDVRLALGFLHTDPWTYVHWDLLGAWETNGYPMGAGIGPNSDELAIRVTRWFPLRTRVMLGARRIRNGFNPVDANGGVVKDVGGDLMATSDAFGYFMRGADIQAYHRVEFELESEPLRGLKVTLRKSAVNVYQGTRIPSREGTTFFRLSYGF